MSKSIPKWLLVLLGVVLLWLAIAAFRHAGTEQDGGLDVYLSDNGCFGGAGKDAPSESECARSEWLYKNWWVLPMGGVVVVGVLIGGYAWASIPGKDIDWPTES